MTTATASAHSTPRSSRFSRTIALARAELTQFLRNPTLLFMALLFPLGLTVAMFVLSSTGGGKAFAASLALETSVLMTMLLVVYYSVLSMSTTRRDEKVLKRLRTGEAKDSDILVAIAAPSSLLAVVLMVLAPILLIVLGAPAPVNVVPLFVAVLGGIAVSAALGFLTSAFTTNAEAAQITSLPVMILAIASQSTFRALMPEQVTRIIDRTPFALMGDLAHLAWSGTTVTGGFEPLDTGAALAAATSPMLILALWVVVLVALVPMYMKWESNR
ncbi:ABC transporter permease [Dermabacter hominis]|uniref:ABC transporter permease n=1 Tax=Dermabacter hominis TaxID=36740 RepID=UPI00242F0D44|nr:ABC transporter permease [Dermabacter hominis]